MIAKSLFKLSSCSLALMISLMVGTNSHAATMTFSVVDYPPYILVDEKNNRISGMDVDIVKAAFASQGQEVSFNVLPWKRIIKSMELGLILGTVSCSKRASRDAFMLFSEPLSNVSRSVVSRTSLDTSQVQELSDLSKFSIVTVDGWGMQKKLIENELEHQSAPDLDSAIKAVMYRDVDLLYMAEYPARYSIKKLDIEEDLKVTSLINEPSLPLHLCISRGFPNATDILRTANKGLYTIKENGLLDEIRAKYLSHN